MCFTMFSKNIRGRYEKSMQEMEGKGVIAPRIRAPVSAVGVTLNMAATLAIGISSGLQDGPLAGLAFGAATFIVMAALNGVVDLGIQAAATIPCLTTPGDNKEPSETTPALAT